MTIRSCIDKLKGVFRLDGEGGAAVRGDDSEVIACAGRALMRHGVERVCRCSRCFLSVGNVSSAKFISSTSLPLCA